MDDQIGVAADRRGEVGVFREVEPEVTDIVGGIDRLHLGAQDHLVDDVGVRTLAGFLQQLVEPVGARRLALRPGDVQRLQEIDQRLHLLQAGRVVDAVDQRGLLGFQRLGGRDVGLDHHFLDQLVGLEAGARGDRRDLAFGVDDDPPLGAFDGQRRARHPALLQHRIGRVERRYDRTCDRAGLVVRRPVGGGLRLLVGQLGGGAHQAADEPMAALPAVRAEDHAHGHAGAVLALAE